MLLDTFRETVKCQSYSSVVIDPDEAGNEDNSLLLSLM